MDRLKRRVAVLNLALNKSLSCHMKMRRKLSMNCMFVCRELDCHIQVGGVLLHLLEGAEKPMKICLKTDFRGFFICLV